MFHFSEVLKGIVIVSCSSELYRRRGRGYGCVITESGVTEQPFFVFSNIHIGTRVLLPIVGSASDLILKHLMRHSTSEHEKGSTKEVEKTLKELSNNLNEASQVFIRSFVLLDRRQAVMCVGEKYGP